MLNSKHHVIFTITAFLLTSLALAGSNLITSTQLQAHCQVPCGIYDDHARVQSMLEDSATVGKAVQMIGELSGKIYAFTRDTPDTASRELFLDIARELAAMGVDGIKSHGVVSSEIFLTLMESAARHDGTVRKCVIHAAIEFPFRNVHVNGELVVKLDPLVGFSHVIGRVVHEFVEDDGTVEHDSRF